MAELAIREMSADAGFAAQLEQALLDDLSALLPQACNTTLAYAAHAACGACVAGIRGSTSYGWLRIGLLWVHPDHRGYGLGRRLLDAAISAAVMRGCHACWLETSNPEARVFYERLGFLEFGKLGNLDGQVTPNHRRWFLQRHIGSVDET